MIKIQEVIVAKFINLCFIDSLNFLQVSLNSLASATPKETLNMTAEISKGNDLLYKKKKAYAYILTNIWIRGKDLVRQVS